jgi:hypothetical protein
MYHLNQSITHHLPAPLTPEYGYDTFNCDAARQYLATNWQMFALIALMYPTIAFKLADFRIPKNSRFDITYLAWNALLFLYSGWTVWMMWDGWVRVTADHPSMTFIQHIRSPLYYKYTCYPSFIFTLSKIAEFGDTALILARGRPLRFIQWYHHLLTYVFCYLSYPITYVSAPPMFCTINACVNTIMYGWYAASTAGFRTPTWFKHLISLIQTTQMFFGCWLIYVANHNNVWRDNDPVVFWVATGMYGSYVFLFSHMLVTNVFGGGGGGGKRKLN